MIILEINILISKLFYLVLITIGHEFYYLFAFKIYIYSIIIEKLLLNKINNFSYKNCKLHQSILSSYL